MKNTFPVPHPHDLLTQLAAGNEEPFLLVYDDFFTALTRFICRQFPDIGDDDVEDLAENTMLRLRSRAFMYQGDRDEAAWRWITTIARRLALDFIRRNKRFSSMDEENDEGSTKHEFQADPATEPENAANDHKDWSEFYCCLSPRQGDVFSLYMEGLAEYKIAARLNISTARVSQILKAVVVKAKKYLGEE